MSCPRNCSAFDVYLASTSDLTQTDLETGAARRYLKRAGSYRSFADPSAFGSAGSQAGSLTEIALPPGSGEPPSAVGELADFSGSGAATAVRHCLLDGRYAVELVWRDEQGRTLPAIAGLATTASALFGLGSAEHAEWLVKLIDARATTGSIWLFYSGATDLAFDLTVTEVASGRQRTYSHAAGSYPSAVDFAAF